MKKTVVSVATLTALAGTSLVNVNANAEEVTVNSGDTLWGIANAVGTTVADLKATNNLSSNLIHPGDVLSYGQSIEEETKQAPKQKAANSVDTYTVKAGDTLWAIGQKFNVAYQSIMEANNLKSDLIFPGQKLSLTANTAVEEVVEEAEVTEEESTPAVEEVATETPVKEEATGAYVIQSGDTLYKISRETGVDVNTLKAINGLKSDLIFPGQVLALTGEVKEEAPAVEEVEAVEEPVVEEEVAVEEAPVVEETPVVEEVTAPVVDNSQVQAEQQEQANRDQEAAAQAERDRVAAEEAAAAEQAEADRLAAEQREQQQVAKQQVEEQKAAQQPNVPVVNTSSKPQQGSYGQNYYFHGDCTWYVFERRKELGKSVSNMWGNGNDWADNARGNGYTVNNTPSVGAIVHSYAGTNGASGYGHVAVVESINPDGSITVSEMNWPTVGVKTTRTISAGNVSSHNFIH